MELVRCKRCESVVSETHINREEQVANCQRCGALFSLQNLDYVAKAKNTKSLKPEIYEIPKGIDIEKYSFELKIIYKTQGFAKFFFTLFSLFWNGIVGIFVIVSILSGNFGILLFVSIHLAIGISMAYYTISLYLNKNKITANSTGLSTTYGPLRFPFRKDYSVPVTDINQIYCRKYSMGTVNGVPQYGYKVALLKNDGQAITIMKALKTYHQALYLEQQIESFLKIEDKAVAEEYSI
ncbi:MAG: hypothetical protein R2728_12005 [Chitinophagales bacterium]